MYKIPDSIQSIREDAECLYTAEQIEKALDELASKINAAYDGTCPVVMCVMNGGMIPTGKLLTRFNFLLQVDYLHATRYHDQTTGEDILWKAEPNIDLKGRSVLIIDDILDEGVTLETVVEFCESRGAKKVMTVVLVEKVHNRKVTSTHADFVGLKINDRYVFGYGMDYKGYLRNASGIFAVRNEK